MMPTTSPPRGGTRMTHGPSRSVVGPSTSRDSVPRKKRLVTRAMSRWRACATPAARRPTPTASVQIHAVRRVTLAACGAMWAEASPGPSDGATGRPSVVDPVLAAFSATASGPGPGWRTAATPTGAGLALEEHGCGRVVVDAHAVNHSLEQLLELPPLTAAEVLQGLDQLHLGRAWCGGEDTLASGRQAQGRPSGIVGSGCPDDQAALGKSLDHHRDRARIGQGPPRQLGHRADRTLAEPLQHEELRGAEAQPRLGGPVSEPESADEASERAERAG